MLIYNESVEEMLQNTRIRFDLASLFPELTNNHIRGTNTRLSSSNSSGTYFGFDAGYLTNSRMSQNTQLIYAGGIEYLNNIFPNFQTDIFLVTGEYDITFRLLPVPPGTYELRLGVNCSGTVKGLSQIYVDNKPIGIPQKMNKLLSDESIGYINDNKTNDNGIKNDQILHYKGYMKAPNTFLAGTQSSPVPARNVFYVARKIIGTFSFTDYQTHTVRFKSANNAEGRLLLDYFELVPKSVYDPPGEGVYETRD
jgi:hypothetical protein